MSKTSSQRVNESEVNPDSTNFNQQSRKRPFSVTILIVMVLIFTTLNILRMITAIRLWDFLANLPLDVPAHYLVITGAIWSGIGFLLAVGLFASRKWSLYLAWIAIVLYPIYYWSDRLLIAERHVIAGRWQFASGLTILLLIFAFWVLLQPKTRAFLMK
jgi:hypothetical protein